MTQIEKLFRVELDGSGAILSCSEIPIGETKIGTKNVRYVHAIDAKAACLAAKTWHSEHKRRDRERQARVREEKRRKLECRLCSEKSLPGRRHCKFHTEANRNGGRTGRQRGGAQVSCYQVLTMLDEQGPVALRKWLVSRIDRIGDNGSVSQAAE
jgi:hypothetical protein